MDFSEQQIIDNIPEVISMITPFGEFSFERLKHKPSIINTDGLGSGLARKLQEELERTKYFERIAELDEKTIEYLVQQGFIVNRHDIIRHQDKLYRQLTDSGRKLKELGSIKEYNKWLKKQKSTLWYFVWGGIFTLIGGLIGALPGIIEEFRKVPQEQKIVLPKIQILHDTVYKEKIVYLKATSSAKSTMIKKESVSKK